MAYLTLVASVPETEISAFRSNPKEVLRASLIEHVSHYLAYSVQIQPLGKQLGEAIDGGDLLSDSLQHPLRPPKLHSVESVRNVHQKLRQLWDQVITEHYPAPQDDWYVIEIKKLIRVFSHASVQSETVVTMLQPPMDRKRAKLVRIPLVLNSKVK